MVVLWCVCDQVVKAYMEAHTPSTALVPVIDGVVGFRLVHNFGAAWGSFSGMVVVLVIVRLVRGYVVDFVEPLFIDFPNFNIADAGITCGIICVLIAFLIKFFAASKHAEHSE